MNSHMARIIFTISRNGPMSPRELETAHVGFSAKDPGLTPDQIRVQVQEGLDNGTLELDDNLKVSLPSRVGKKEVWSTEPCDTEDGPCACGAWHINEVCRRLDEVHTVDQDDPLQPTYLQHLEARMQVKETLRRMDPAELRETFIDVGILTPDGKLTKAYGGTE